VIDPGLNNNISGYYSKSYLRHLTKSKEILGLTIASIQNLAFYLWLVTEARKRIVQGDFHAWKKDIIPHIMRRL
jgi:queuine tRNA-ribosyltransferase